MLGSEGYAGTRIRLREVDEGEGERTEGRRCMDWRRDVRSGGEMVIGVDCERGGGPAAGVWGGSVWAHDGSTETRCEVVKTQ